MWELVENRWMVCLLCQGRLFFAASTSIHTNYNIHPVDVECEGSGARGSGHSHSSGRELSTLIKGARMGKKQSSSRPDQDNRDVTPWINYHFHLCYIYLFLHRYFSTPPHHSFRFPFPSTTEDQDVCFNLKGKGQKKTWGDLKQSDLFLTWKFLFSQEEPGLFWVNSVLPGHHCHKQWNISRQESSWAWWWEPRRRWEQRTRQGSSSYPAHLASQHRRTETVFFLQE